MKKILLILVAATLAFAQWSGGWAPPPRFEQPATFENTADFQDTVTFTMSFFAKYFIDVTVPKLPTSNPAAEGTEDEFPTLDFDAATDEQVFYQFTIPCGYKTSGAINVHFCFFVDGAVTGDQDTVTWGVEYKRLVHGTSAFDFGAGTASVTADVEITTTTDEKVVLDVTLSGLTLTGWNSCDHVLMRFYRDADATNDTYAADARICQIHMDIEQDRLGKY